MRLFSYRQVARIMSSTKPVPVPKTYEIWLNYVAYIEWAIPSFTSEYKTYPGQEPVILSSKNKLEIPIYGSGFSRQSIKTT